MSISDERRSPYTFKRFLISLVVIVIGIFVLVVVLYASVDIRCAKEANRWLVAYPDSEILSDSYTGFRPFGLGITTRWLHSTDDKVTVRRWYTERNNQLSQEGYSIVGGISRLQMGYSDATEEEGGGTIIRLNSECAVVYVFW